MRNFLFTLLFMLSFLSSHSKCKFGGLYVWPYKGDISTNPVFMLMGFDDTQEVLKNLNKKHRVYLKSGKEKIDLYVVEIKRGALNMTQALVKTKEFLKPGKTYRLKIDGVSDTENNELNDHPGWQVKNYKDLTRPVWVRTPDYIKSRIIHYGCGPDKNLIFCYCTNEKPPVLIQAQMKEITTGKIQDMYVPVENNYLEIGHGMCGGPFEFGYDKDLLYQLTFTIIDASGNRSVTFHSPDKLKAPYEDASSKHKLPDCACEIKEENQFPVVALLSLLSLSLVMSVWLLMQKQRKRKRIRLRKQTK